MNEKKAGDAVKLYVFVDNLKYKSIRPIIVYINKYKTFYDVKNEFSDKKCYPFNEQHWIMNKMYCYDGFEIIDVIENMSQFQNGFVAFLFILSEIEKGNIPEYYGSFLEKRYLNVNEEDRWNQPEETPMIIADVVDTTKPMTVIGWNCELCTFLNKAFMPHCSTCGSARPDSFEMPKNYFFTKEDKKSYLELLEIDENAKKLEEETRIKLEEEKKDQFTKLVNLINENLIYSTEAIDCPICGSECAPGEAIMLRNCFHTICKDCMKEYLMNINDPFVKCFVENCMGFVENREIQAVLTEEEFEQYEQLSLRLAESKTDNTFHCKTPNCIAWVIYDDDVNFFPCPICKHENCLLCKAIHEGQNCEQYQEEMKIKARNDEAAKKDLEFLQNLIDTGEAMKCPGCKIIVQKKSGCDWMMCNMCKTELCWATKGARWGPKGKGDTSGGCQCNVKGKCHPKCINCH